MQNNTLWLIRPIKRMLLIGRHTLAKNGTAFRDVYDRISSFCGCPFFFIGFLRFSALGRLPRRTSWSVKWPIFWLCRGAYYFKRRIGKGLICINIEPDLARIWLWAAARESTTVSQVITHRGWHCAREVAGRPKILFERSWLLRFYDIDGISRIFSVGTRISFFSSSVLGAVRCTRVAPARACRYLAVT